MLDLTSVTARLLWRLPASVRDDEALLVNATLEPARLALLDAIYKDTWLTMDSSLTAFAGHGAFGREHSVRLPCAGAYVLVGVTDLGPFRVAVDVPAGGGDVVVDLTPIEER